MQPSQKCLDVIEKYEGFREKAYLDSANPPVPTIGIGTTVYKNGVKVKMGDTITRQTAYFELNDHLQNKVVLPIQKLITTSINQDQFDALCSLCYNIGLGAFSKSSLLVALNNRDFILAQKKFLDWNISGGKKTLGLTRRRLTEATLFGPLTRQNLIDDYMNGIDPGDV